MILHEQDYNGDLLLWSFEKSNYIWAGGQKKDTLPAISEPKDYMGHINQAIRMEFSHTPEIEIPSEIKDSLDWISTTDPLVVYEFRVFSL